MDLDFGITSPYLKPSFLIKVVTGAFASITLIYLFVLDANLFEYLWRLCGNKNGDFTAAITAFFILAIIINVLIHRETIISKIPFIGDSILKRVIVGGAFSGFVFILALGYGIDYSHFQKYKAFTTRFFTYYAHHPNIPEYQDWLRKYVKDQSTSYFDNRLKTSASCMLGLFITLAILNAIELFYLYKTGGFEYSRGDIASPINAQSDVPVYG